VVSAGKYGVVIDHNGKNIKLFWDEVESVKKPGKHGESAGKPGPESVPWSDNEGKAFSAPAGPKPGTWAAKHDAELKANGWKVAQSYPEPGWYEKDGHGIFVRPDGTWEHFLPGKVKPVDHGNTPLSLVAQQVGEAKAVAPATDLGYHGAKVGDQVTLAIGPGGSPVKGHVVGVEDGIPKVRLAEAIPGNTAYPAGSHTFPEPEELTHIAGKPTAAFKQAAALTAGHLKVGDDIETNKGHKGKLSSKLATGNFMMKDSAGKVYHVSPKAVVKVNGKDAGEHAASMGGTEGGQPEKPKVALKDGEGRRLGAQAGHRARQERQGGRQGAGVRSAGWRSTGS